MNYTIKESRDSPTPVTRTMTMVLDGFNAPVSAGCFMDLVNQKWYDGMEIQRADGFVVQTGRPKKGEGYIDPKTGMERKYASPTCRLVCILSRSITC
jgi:cyclophilin family peptidyl-prolyl cis-trans isomerase